MKHFIIMLIFLPLFTSIFSALVVRSEALQFSREIKGLTILLYRYLLLIMLFYVGFRASQSKDFVSRFVRANLYFSSVIVLMALINYFKLFDFIVMEKIIAQFDALNIKSISDKRIGLGFLGYLRPSVGHLFSILAIMQIGCISLLPKSYKPFALLVIAGCMLVVFLSYSRAGMLGAGVGILILAVLGSGASQKIYSVVAASILLIVVVLNFDLIGDRIISITDTETGTGGGRIQGWLTGIQYLGNNAVVILFGFGAVNRQGVFEVLGAYGAHNEYLDAIFRSGIFMLIFLLLTIYKFYNVFWKAKKIPDRVTRVIATTGIAVLSISVVIAITQNSFLLDYSNYTVAAMLYLIYGIFVGYCSNATDKHLLNRRNRLQKKSI